LIVVLGSTSKSYYPLKMSRKNPPIVEGGKICMAFPATVRRTDKDGKVADTFTVLARPYKEEFGNILLRVLTSIPRKITSPSTVTVVSGDPKLMAFGSGRDGNYTWTDQVYWMRSMPVNDTLKVSLNGKQTVLKMSGEIIKVMSPEEYSDALDVLGGRLQDSEEVDGREGLVSAAEIRQIMEGSEESSDGTPQ
jgi:hypothetical protein